MTREESINEWIIPAIKNTWNEKKCKEIIKALEQKPCDDAISRQDLLNLPRIRTRNVFGELIYESIYVHDVEKLPSVTPAEKVGRWIESSDGIGRWWECSQCGAHGGEGMKYCMFCGAKMQEVEV